MNILHKHSAALERWFVLEQTVKSVWVRAKWIIMFHYKDVLLGRLISFSPLDEQKKADSRILVTGQFGWVIHQSASPRGSRGLLGAQKLFKNLACSKLRKWFRLARFCKCTSNLEHLIAYNKPRYIRRFRKWGKFMQENYLTTNFPVLLCGCTIPLKDVTGEARDVSQCLE